MKATISWKRNTPTTVSGESITVTFTYSSFSKEEIDNLQKTLPQGIVTADLNPEGKEKKHDRS